MDIKEYQRLAERTEARPNHGIQSRLVQKARDIHAIMGMVTEVGELTDAYKKYVFYGREMDLVNVMEELGDLFWYIALILNATGIDIDVVLERNNEKLQARFQEKFTEKEATVRDLDKEREVLEDSKLSPPVPGGTLDPEDIQNLDTGEVDDDEHQDMVEEICPGCHKRGDHCICGPDDEDDYLW